MSDLRIKELELEIEKIKQGQNLQQPKKSTFSVWWFIFWVIVFWPIAIIYAIIKSCEK